MSEGDGRQTAAEMPDSQPAAETTDSQRAVETADGQPAAETADGQPAVEREDSQRAVETADGQRAVETQTVAEADQSLVVVCGPPGVGKTTVARTAADYLGGSVLRTDVVRKDLSPEPSYDDAATRAVYDQLLSRAQTRLAAGDSVVLDGTFRTRTQRERAAVTAATVGSGFRLFRVACEESVVRRRLAAREDDASDADFGIYQTVREQFESVALDHDRIDNTGTSGATCRRVERLLRADESSPEQ